MPLCEVRACNLSILLPAIPTCHPFAASSFATSIPMPDVAPITIAFFAI